MAADMVIQAEFTLFTVTISANFVRRKVTIGKMAPTIRELKNLPNKLNRLENIPFEKILS
ncbi:hypothetical protein [Asticcacaulis endophyticus]|uniref:Uncharacterized protein n=1 Tax=Asticcacaulis endophyticus TaxID=1395890 RepID=A0A918UYN7_9CAUL|nr:hypothetical protein [Asticcacaulis endophyticus]GGZ45953.1 hypothetical protein GCM10011273_35730 [Asticcacaulis endophyticus]